MPPEYFDKQSSSEQLLNQDNSASIHHSLYAEPSHRNVQNCKSHCFRN